MMSDIDHVITSPNIGLLTWQASFMRKLMMVSACTLSMGLLMSGSSLAGTGTGAGAPVGPGTAVRFQGDSPSSSALRTPSTPS